MEAIKPIQHRMTRRMATHNYSRPGIYHITIHVAEGMGQPLGQIEGSPAHPDGCQSSPQMVLTPIGNMVREELLSSITGHYRMIAIDTYVIMPEHLHFIVNVSAPIISKNGKPTHLGQVIAGFKKGCNRRYWDMTGQTAPTGEPLDTKPAASPAGGSPAPMVSGGSPASMVPGGSPAPMVSGGTPAPMVPGGTPAPMVPGGSPAPMVSGGSPARKRTPSCATTGRPPLFAYGYCDVMPLSVEQLETQRAYIQNNPRSRWLRSTCRDRLHSHRGGIDTALTPSALRRYLQRECPQALAMPTDFAAIECRLLLAGGKVALDTYGDRTLLNRTLLPVVCHRKDKERFHEQKARCLEAAAQSAVLVSPRIAPGEQDIMNELVNHGFPVILIADNGFPEIYHPSSERITLCAEGRLMLVSPWHYQYRGKNESISVLFCKTMNCIAQALCRLKDDWWKY